MKTGINAKTPNDFEGVEVIADILAADNPRFDRERFFKEMSELLDGLFRLQTEIENQKLFKEVKNG